MIDLTDPDRVREQHIADLYAHRMRQWRTDERIALARGIVPFALGLAVFLACMWLAGQGCGDVHAEPTPAAVEELPHPSASQETPAAPDVEAFALAMRMRAWQPTWQERTPGELAAVASAIVTGCRRDPWPDRERCPDLLAALAFRESSWRVAAIGARGEAGLLQLHGAALAGEGRRDALDPDVNVRLGLAWLREAERTCARAGWGRRADFDARVLGAYGGSGCRATRGARMALRWADQIAAVTAEGDRR